MRPVSALLLAGMLALSILTSACTSTTVPPIPEANASNVTGTTAVLPTLPGLQQETSVPPVYQRPATGTLVAGEDLRGAIGELILYNNDTAADAVAALYIPGLDTSLTSVYIRHGEKYAFESLDDGHYNLYLMFGSAWDPNRKQFTEHATYLHYSDVLIYQTLSRSNAQNPFFHFTSNEFWISTSMGNVDRVSPAEFPGL
jgi:hypothetical protein